MDTQSPTTSRLVVAVAPARTLWDLHDESIIADVRTTMSAMSATETAVKDIDLRLQKHEKYNVSVGLAEVYHETTTEYQRLLAAFNPYEIAPEADEVVPQLTAGQRTVFDHVVHAANEQNWRNVHD